MSKNINRNSDKPRNINEQHVEHESPECFHSVGIPKDFSNKAERDRVFYNGNINTYLQHLTAKSMEIV